MKKLFKKLNKQGSALVAVIVCVLFVGIIASIVLTLATSNFNGGKLGRKSTDNFYSAENVVDELKTSLQEFANDAMAEAYKQWLQKYALVDGDTHLTEFKRIFCEEMKKKLQKYFNVIEIAGDGSQTALGTPTEDITELLYKFDTSNVDFTDIPTVYIDSDGNLSIENISIAFNETTGFSSTITTDLAFGITYPTIKANQVSGLNMNIPQYAIIADGTVKNFYASAVDGLIVPAPAVSAGDAIVYGSVYGGGKGKSGAYDTNGIWLRGGNTKLYSDYILSRTTFETENGATVTVKGRRGKYDGIFEDGRTKYFYSNIWAKNIEMSGSSSSTMNVQGSCYLADDLTMNADGSSFKLNREGSAFYGYNTNNRSTDSAESSSSVVINGERVTVDFLEANTVWLAGKSFIYVPRYWGKDASAEDKTFQQGESISYRALQAAYMVPGECIVGVGHNPLSEDEFRSVCPDPNNLSTSKIDITQSSLNGGINLISYVDRSKPWTFASVSYGGENLIYVYLNFTNPDSAAEYFNEYYTRNSDLVEQRMEQLKDGKILLDPLSLISTGNVLAYSDPTPEDGNDSDRHLTFIAKSASIYGSTPDIIGFQSEATMRYKGLYTSLSEDSFGPENDITRNLVNMTAITSNFCTDLGIKLDDDDNTKPEAYLVTATSDVYISGDSVIAGSTEIFDEGIHGGIILAKGNVYIETGVHFYGTIISGGSVFIGGGTQLQTVPSSIQRLIQTHPSVTPFFSLGKDYGTEKGGMTDTSDLVDITYKNWKKN